VEALNKGTPFGSMAYIYTSSGRSARDSRKGVNAGNAGVNIGWPPRCLLPLWREGDSFYGRLHPQVDTVDFTDKSS